MGVPTGPGHSRLAVDDDVRIDHAGGHQRRERQDGGGGVAAGVGDGGGLEIASRCSFGEPVAPLCAQVAGEVDDQRAAVGQLLRDRGRGAVRERQKRDVAVLERRGLAAGGGHPQGRVGGDQAGELAAGIAGGTGDAGVQNGRVRKQRGPRLHENTVSMHVYANGNRQRRVGSRQRPGSPPKGVSAASRSDGAPVR